MMMRHFSRRLGHIRRQSDSEERQNKQDDFRTRSQSLDGTTKHHVPFDFDCETTYRIYESILRQGTGRESHTYISYLIIRNSNLMH